MNILREPISPSVNLEMQGIDTKGMVSFAHVVRAILENREKNPGNMNSKNWADQQAASVNLPLRSAIVQQVSLSKIKLRAIRRETEIALTGSKIAQIAAGKKVVQMVHTEEEIQEGMSLRVTKALQLKVETATRKLLGEIPLIGFHREDGVANILSGKLKKLEKGGNGKVMKGEGAIKEVVSSEES